jgi:hypothetical protein
MLPHQLGGVCLCDAKSTPALQDEASSPHHDWPYFFEADQLSFGETHKLLNAFVTSVRLSSDVDLEVGPYAIEEPDWPHMIASPPKQSAASWGHYGKTLSTEALEFAVRFSPRLAHFSMRQSFNRVSNALRLYTSALDLNPSDVALVVFISVLEGLFSTATQELSYRLGLAVSWFLASAKDERLQLFGEVKDLYAIRSKIVHGNRITRDEEQAAILLAENYVPRAEELVRRSIRKILEEGIDGFIETTNNLDAFYQLLVLGFTAPEALERLSSSSARLQH